MAFDALHTDRLLLRPVRLADATSLWERRNHPRVAALQAWTLPYSLDDAEGIVGRAAAMDGPQSDEWWMLTIADPDDTTILGDLAIHPTWNGRAVEIGYTLAPARWGHGFALEAVEALVDRLFEDATVSRVHAMTHPDNIASAQVLERTGFLFEGRTRLSYWVGDDNTDDVLYGVTRADRADWRDRPRSAPADVRLVEIDHENAAAVRALATHKSQERFVSPVAKSYGDALFPAPYDGVPVEPWLRAIAADGELAGFVMLAFAPGHPPCLWRLLVDRRHQHRGIGNRTIDLVIDHVRKLGATALDVYWREGRGSPKPLYERRGFVPTGVIDDGEIEARLALD